QSSRQGFQARPALLPAGNRPPRKTSAGSESFWRLCSAGLRVIVRQLYNNNRRMAMVQQEGKMVDRFRVRLASAALAVALVAGLGIGPTLAQVAPPAPGKDSIVDRIRAAGVIKAA